MAGGEAVDSSSASQAAGPASHGPALRRAPAWALAGYLLLSVLFLSRTWFGGDLGRRLVGGGGDPLGFVWFLAWLPHALEHGQSPFFTTILMSPQGANLLNSTAVSLSSLLLWPVTAIGGSVFSYDLLATLAVCLSAWAAYFSLGRLTHHSSSAWIGGAIYGFGGYMAGQATAHVNLMIAVFPPVAALLIDDLRGTRSPARTGLLLGLCAAAQVFVNEEILATTAIMALVAGVWAALISRPTWAMVKRYAIATAVAAAVVALLAGPAVFFQLFGPQHVHGVIVSSGRYVNDLAGFFVPNSVAWLSTAGSRHLSSGFSGYDGEFGSYLGVPLLALLLLAGWRLRRRALLLGLLLVSAAVFSLGPHLRILDHDTGIFLPWIIPNHLPLLENAVPSRFNLYLWLAAAALVVLLIDDLRARPLLGHPALGVCACAVALIAILPSRAPSEIVRIPRVAASASALRTLVPGARTVLIVPSTNGQLGMFAQAKAGFAYRIPDGGVFVPNADGASYGMRHGPLLYALAALGGHVSTKAGRTHEDVVCLKAIAHRATLSADCDAHYRSAIGALHLDAVVVSDFSSPTVQRRYVRFFTSLLGRPAVTETARVFDAAPALAAQSRSVAVAGTPTSP